MRVGPPPVTSAAIAAALNGNSIDGSFFNYATYGPSYPADLAAGLSTTSSNMASLGTSGTGSITCADVSTWPDAGWVRLPGAASTFEISRFAKIDGTHLNIDFRDPTGTITPVNGGTIVLHSTSENPTSNTTSSDMGTVLGGHGTGIITVGDVSGWPDEGWMQIFTGSSGLSSSYEMSHYVKVDDTHINVDIRDPGGVISPSNGGTLSLIVQWSRFTPAGHASFVIMGDGRVGIGDAPANNQFELRGNYEEPAGTRLMSLDMDNILHFVPASVFDATLAIGPDATVLNNKLQVSQASATTGRLDVRFEHVNNSNLQFSMFGSAHAARASTAQIAGWNAEMSLAFVVDTDTNVYAGTSLKGLFVKSGGGVGFGTGLGMTLTRGEVAFPKITDPAAAVGAGFAKMLWVAGTDAGTAKLVAYAGTSTTPVTIIDNVGTGF